MYYLGIDLGGTNIVAGIVDEDGKIIVKASCKTTQPCTQVFRKTISSMSVSVLRVRSTAKQALLNLPITSISTTGKS